MSILDAIKQFGGPTLTAVVADAIKVGLQAEEIAAIVIPHTVEFAVQEIKAEIAKRTAPTP